MVHATRKFMSLVLILALWSLALGAVQSSQQQSLQKKGPMTFEEKKSRIISCLEGGGIAAAGVVGAAIAIDLMGGGGLATP